MRIIKLKYKNLENQLEKVEEEFNELADELTKDTLDPVLILSEAWDLIQATFGIIFIILKKEGLEKSYKEHMLKLQDRNKKQIEIDEYLDL